MDGFDMLSILLVLENRGTEERKNYPGLYAPMTWFEFQPSVDLCYDGSRLDWGFLMKPG